MGCETSEAQLLGIGVRLGLYLQGIAFCIVLFRGMLWRSREMSDMTLVTFMALVLSVSLQLVRYGTDALTAREMTVLTYIIFQNTPLIVLGQRGLAVRYWVHWILRGGQEAQVKNVRTGLRFHIVVGVGMQILAYAILLLFWIVLFKDMRCSSTDDVFAFFFYRFHAHEAVRWIMATLCCMYTLVLVYWLIDAIRDAHVSKKQVQWCQDMLQVLNGSKKETSVTKGSFPKGAFIGALMAVIEVGDSRAEAVHGSRPTSAITSRAVAVEELVDGAQVQARLFSTLLFVWVVSNALGVELLLQWNSIGHTGSLLNYDQLLPFLVGLWLLIQSCFPPDESSTDSEHSLRHVTRWCDAGQTSVLDTVRSSKISSDGELTRNFLRYFL